MSHNNVKITDKSCQKYIFELSKIIVSMLHDIKYEGLQRYYLKTAENTVPLAAHWIIGNCISWFHNNKKIINCVKVKTKMTRFKNTFAGSGNTKSVSFNGVYEQIRCTNLLRKFCTLKKLEAGMKGHKSWMSFSFW